MKKRKYQKPEVLTHECRETGYIDLQLPGRRWTMFADLVNGFFQVRVSQLYEEAIKWGQAPPLADCPIPTTPWLCAPDSNAALWLLSKGHSNLHAAQS